MAPERRSRKTEEGYVPRPRNCFMVFRTAYQEEVHALFGETDMKAVSRDAAAVWHAMNEEDKDYWRGQAEGEKDEHKARHPDYKFKAQKRSRRKEGKGPSEKKGKEESKGRARKGENDDEEEKVAGPSRLPAIGTRASRSRHPEVHPYSNSPMDRRSYREEDEYVAETPLIPYMPHEDYTLPLHLPQNPHLGYVDYSLCEPPENSGSRFYIYPQSISNSQVYHEEFGQQLYRQADVQRQVHPPWQLSHPFLYPMGNVDALLFHNTSYDEPTTPIVSAGSSSVDHADSMHYGYYPSEFAAQHTTAGSTIQDPRLDMSGTTEYYTGEVQGYDLPNGG
ncbi:hypothetical protein D9613_007332 [Agrocybe pediades]|uniref:HMG box domain-containing protein n=1 Tax=Agrocybe pediades TaxID=84607 RepID=A0A8H4VJX1_9AGAR|nr:hypothetical protein D9613_007332 [Agrocybe pediades]